MNDNSASVGRLGADSVKSELAVRNMNKTITDELTAEEAELIAAIENSFSKIEREHEQMRRDREEFARSKARTRAMLAEIKAA